MLGCFFPSSPVSFAHCAAMVHTSAASPSSPLTDFNIKPAAHETADKASMSSVITLRRMYVLGIGLHVGLVLLHLVLVVIHFPHKYENRISVPLGAQSNTLSVAIIVVSQGFAVVYLAAIVYLMQQLSLRRNLDIQQTLTAFHDKHAAWSGPGSALSTLYKQRRLQTASSSLFLICLYVSGASTLHVTTPSLVSLATSNKTSAGYASLYSSRPNYYEAEIAPQGLSDAISVLPTLPLLQNVNATAGLYGNIIFDTTRGTYQAYWNGERPLAQGFQVPNATVFNVTCGNLAGVKQVGAGNATSWFLQTPVRNVTDGKYNPLRFFYPYGIRFIPQEYEVADMYFASQTLVLAATVNITDSEGNNGSTFAVDPAFTSSVASSVAGVNWPLEEIGGLPSTFNPVVVACSLVASRTNINVDATTKNITQDSIDANPRKTHRLWSAWTEPERDNDLLVQSWASIFMDTSISSVIATSCDDPHWYSDSPQQCQIKDYLTVVEKYVNDGLKIRPFSGAFANFEDDNHSVNLYELENVLEDLTAAVFWSDANFPTTSLDYSTAENLSEDNNVDVIIYDPNAQLTINEIPLLTGLLCSIGLLGIACYLVRWPQETTIDSDLDMVGLLQFAWLLGKGSDVQDTVSDVMRPNTDNLRTAGMTEVTLSSLVHRSSSERR
ncbi:hypothetical protein B0H16DRAFT_367189 [Mycena metata]|uniref:Uncharacterized protein n=1 Tax=Mycena metata TaxID=1033252 RepID=A0AAD7HIG7_9AGAR|nr:hypothetical protein B0H16DRAFT_367189 [Mycena metata]